MTARRTTAAVAVVALTAGMLAACGASEAQTSDPPDLNGTIWCSPTPHSRVAVDVAGAVDVQEAQADLCFTFESRAGLYALTIDWWNARSGVRNREHAIAVPVNATELRYREAERPGDTDFVGIVGGGDIRLLSDTQMRITQVGYLANGAAGAFTNTLDKVDALPDIPVPLPSSGG